jgi:hypothetical protein
MNNKKLITNNKEFVEYLTELKQKALIKLAEVQVESVRNFSKEGCESNNLSKFGLRTLLNISHVEGSIVLIDIIIEQLKTEDKTNENIK